MRSRLNNKSSLFLILCLAALVGVVLVHGGRAAAQTDEAWVTPVNISRSGAATMPLPVVTADGTVHVFWLENERDYAYARTVDDGWSDSRVIEPPFATRLYSPDLSSNAPKPIFTPVLVADNTGRIAAFWINDDDELVFSDVEAAALESGTVFDWREPTVLAGSALAAVSAIDDDNRIHVVYFRSAESDDLPAGLYHIASEDGGSTWSEAALLYPSRYFRSLIAADTHAAIISAENSIYVVWDSRPEEKVYFIRSDDGGATWGEPQEIDRREAADGRLAAGPSNIIAAADGDNVLLVWRANHDNAPVCNLYYQTSADRGDTWSERQTLTSLAVCPDAIQIVTGDEGNTILMASGSELSNLLGWDWNRSLWSNPQRESSISQFTNSDTFRTVELACQQAALRDDAFFVFGCDVAEGADVWALTRTLADFGGWFPSPTDWRDPIVVQDGLPDIVSTAIATDNDGQVHLIWTDTLGESIQYTRYENGRWVAPIEALSSTDGRVADPALALDSSGRLFVIWTNPETGELLFSQVDTTRAVAQAEWATPQIIATSDNVVSSPQLAVTKDDRLVAVYAAPLNEGRGVYMVMSGDNGATWSEPRLLFDAAAAGWVMVDDPGLHIAEDGRWHLLWTQHTVPGAGGPIALYTAYSDDEGMTLSSAELVSDTPVLWSRVTTTGDMTVHRIWQSAVGDLVTLWHQQSDDNGFTWQNPIRVSSFGDAAGPAALVRDKVGRLHLMQLQASGLHYWMWDGNTWTGDRDISIVPQTINADQLQAGLDADGSLVVVYGGANANQFDDQNGDIFFFSGRSLDYPDGLPTPEPTSTPEMVATPTPTQEAVAETQPQLTFPLDPPTTTALGSASRIEGLALGAVAATLFVILALVIGLRLTRFRRKT
ncbi:MAG: glycoside hydrolase [Anaerolineae bacterium]|nr:glycoside hydrolase [Anaerolineae bacterium]MCO5199186.1 glycoside hydrolase [Anaerolineae bacterium]